MGFRVSIEKSNRKRVDHSPGIGYTTCVGWGYEREKTMKHEAAEFLGGTGVVVSTLVTLVGGFWLVGCVVIVLCGLVHISGDF